MKKLLKVIIPVCFVVGLFAINGYSTAECSKNLDKANYVDAIQEKGELVQITSGKYNGNYIDPNSGEVYIDIDKTEETGVNLLNNQNEREAENTLASLTGYHYVDTINEAKEKAKKEYKPSGALNTIILIFAIPALILTIIIGKKVKSSTK